MTKNDSKATLFAGMMILVLVSIVAAIYIVIGK